MDDLIRQSMIMEEKGIGFIEDVGSNIFELCLINSGLKYLLREVKLMIT